MQRWSRNTTGYNSVLPQLAVTCKIEDECSYQTFVLGDSEVLRNRQLRQHAKRLRHVTDEQQAQEIKSLLNFYFEKKLELLIEKKRKGGGVHTSGL